jgi:hypothetical protein
VTDWDDLKLNVPAPKKPMQPAIKKECLNCGITDATVYLVVRDRKGYYRLCSMCYRDRAKD